MPASLETRAKNLDRIADPAVRALTAHQLVADIEAVMARAVYERDAAILAAHERGASFADIAKRLGVSRTRVQQFIARARSSSGPAALRTKGPVATERPPAAKVPIAV